jgi:hypothetical protein
MHFSSFVLKGFFFALNREGRRGGGGVEALKFFPLVKRVISFGE